MPKIYFANEDWFPTHNNLFTSDGKYGVKWSAFIYDDTLDYYTNVIPDTKVYTLSVAPAIDRDYQRLKDFIIYETGYQRNVIIKANNNMRSAIEKFVNEIEYDKTEMIRNSDPQWLVHSTTADLWDKIKETGSLLAPSVLKKRHIPIKEIGLKALIEPEDYSDYIMLDILNGCGEIVVNSRQLGYVCTNTDMAYNPGVRLYFDAHKIIEAGLGVRDGLHILKVKTELPLDKYMIMAVTKDMLEHNNIWTPTSYTEAANQYFMDSLPSYQCR